MNKISLLDIVHDTTVDGPGFRTAIYAAGCKHQCQGCHNPRSWNIKNGIFHTIDSIMEIIKENEFAEVTFTGGDPLMQAEGFTELAQRIKTETEKNIWCYTGFSYENIITSGRLMQILPYLDVLVDGRYIHTLRNADLQFRGSSNQRIINVQESLVKNEVIIRTSDSFFRKQYPSRRRSVP
ncbi:MAG: anaerobic ribonucleoside-triphosphate reductase activating protein [Tannerella sp.]|jgi:anaerobic ribonucleoside-triphosphate reductase activating protein|nr:anaerobic ribonucleoside-triphosphate reductase activating protein [Tannerella sp.]